MEKKLDLPNLVNPCIQSHKMIYERVPEDRSFNVYPFYTDLFNFFKKKTQNFHFSIFINAIIIIMRLFKDKTIKEYLYFQCFVHKNFTIIFLKTIK